MMALARKVNSTDLIIASLQGPNAFFVRSESEPTKPRIGFGWMMQYKAGETISLHHQTVLSIIERASADHDIDRSAIFVTHSIHDAVFLGQRVITLSGRPTRVIEQTEVNLPVPRTPDLWLSERLTPYLTSLRNQLARSL